MLDNQSPDHQPAEERSSLPNRRGLASDLAKQIFLLAEETQNKTLTWEDTKNLDPEKYEIDLPEEYEDLGPVPAVKASLNSEDCQEELSDTWNQVTIGGEFLDKWGGLGYHLLLENNRDQQYSLVGFESDAVERKAASLLNTAIHLLDPNSEGDLHNELVEKLTEDLQLFRNQYFE
jgi:hypothetical protein